MSKVVPSNAGNHLESNSSLGRVDVRTGSALGFTSTRDGGTGDSNMTVEGWVLG